jgi:hypothetical protein
VFHGSGKPINGLPAVRIGSSGVSEQIAQRERWAIPEANSESMAAAGGGDR